MFYDWGDCGMGVLGTTKYSSCNRCIDTWQKSCSIVYSKLLSVQLEFRAVVLYAQSVFYAVQCCLCSRCFTQYSIVCTTDVVRSTILYVQLDGVLGSSALYHGSSGEFSIVPREFWGVQYCTTGVLGGSILYHGSSGEFSIVPREFWGVPYCTTGVLGSSVLYHGSSGEFSIVPREF